MQDKIPSHVSVQRITFSEITPSAIKRAIAAPRAVDQNLVEAYLARICADYLLGFSVSPMLWRKLPGARSAGRVQSVALRLLADREVQRDMHKSVKYFTTTVNLAGEPHCDQVRPRCSMGAKTIATMSVRYCSGSEDIFDALALHVARMSCPQFSTVHDHV